MENKKITYNERDFKAYSRSTIYIQKQTNRLLSFSLLWLGVAILFIGLITFAILSIEPLFSFYLRIALSITSNAVTIIASVLLLIGINWGISHYISKRALAEKPSTFFLFFLFLVFVLANSSLLPMFFTFQIWLGNSHYIMIAIGGAGGLMTLIGLLGHFKVINFGKILPLLMIGFLIELALGIATYFIFSSVLEVLYSLTGITVTLGMIGYQFWLIRNQSSQILAFYDDEAEIKRVFIRIAIWNALTLYVSFIRLILFIIRLLNSRF
ncbi:Uncharacterised protein [Mesomycoplasma dispar]|uniref:Inhibitor of apoptosis-promoting Bax1 n=1 Tax=Mesomycoplasma dispar TaxID=86660 RepID=A0AAJ5NM50_9BACT|nr:Bax inhibitor-1 family protein [Mesomycoplasma dispar]AJR11966.1 hypothetical protein MDIS_00475 [Mesomycoplasma dispar]VEU61249.1 Uncharacterised protein [Mesomycoplasma dispar]